MQAMLAAGAGAMSETDREAMLAKERERSKEAAAQERARMEAAYAEENHKTLAKLNTLQQERDAAHAQAEEAERERVSAGRQLKREKEVCQRPATLGRARPPCTRHVPAPHAPTPPRTHHHHAQAPHRHHDTRTINTIAVPPHAPPPPRTRAS